MVVRRGVPALALAALLGACGTDPSPTASPLPSAILSLSPSEDASPSDPIVASVTPGSPTRVGDGEEWIVFQGAPLGLSLIRPDGSGNHVILGPPGDQVHPDWSPDGSRIAYVQVSDAASEIWITDPLGTNPEPLLTAFPDAMADLFWDNPAWSPDGSQIATVGYAGNPGTELPSRSVFAIVAVDSGEITVVGSMEQSDGTLHSFPRWSPDGSAFVINVDHFDADEFLGSTVAIVRRSDTGWSAPDPVTDVGQWARPDWHPTDDLLVYCDYDVGGFQATAEPSNLFTIRPDGTEWTQVTDFGPNEDRASQPSWTLDGRIIFTYVTGVADQERSVAFVNADGSGLEIAAGPGIVGQNNRPHPRLRPVR